MEGGGSGRAETVVSLRIAPGMMTGKRLVDPEGS